MTQSIPDNYSEFPGQLAGYDTAYPFSTAFLNEILADQHVDLRIFSNTAVFALRTQEDLDAETQTQLDGQTQTQLETVQVGPGEAWAVVGSPTGTSGSLSVGTILSRNNWRGAQMSCNGSALSLTLQSSMSSGGINISSQDVLSFVFPDFHSFNTTTSTIQLCSNATGDFTTANSAIVPFSASTGSATEIRLALSAFANSGFTLTAVSGVKIILHSNVSPTAGQVVTLMAMRALKSTWKYHSYDLDTRRSVFTSVPSLDGGDPLAANAFVPLIRGVTGGTTDPRPMDGTTTLAFNTGNLTATSSSTPYNSLQLIFRENQGSGTGRYIVAELDFRNGSSRASTFKSSNGSTVAGSTINYTNLPALAPNAYYIFEANLNNQALTLNLYTSNQSGVITAKIWTSTLTSTGTNSNYVREQGRFGWNLSLIDRDAFLVSFNATAISFSTMRTKVFSTYSPVDGAQLAATFASDTNLWQSFQGQNVVLDQTKITAGNSGTATPSYRTTYPIFSNEFPVDDFAQMYVNFDLYVPAQVTPGNQPYVSMISTDGLNSLTFGKPALQPNQWNHITIDLEQAQGHLTGIFYRLWIGAFTPGSPPAAINIPYTWWVDNMVIGRRNVSWQFTANPTVATWREFRNVTNDPYGGLKLPVGERGTEIQLQAVALNQDAWISDFSLIPRYAPLGKPTYY